MHQASPKWTNKMKLTKAQQKEYEEYLDEQIKILHHHFSLIMIRLINKAGEIGFTKPTKEGGEWITTTWT